MKFVHKKSILMRKAAVLTAAVLIFSSQEGRIFTSYGADEEYSNTNFDFGTVSGYTFTNGWANMSISIPHGFTVQTGKEMYSEIYYEPEDSVYDGGEATDILLVCPEYMEAYRNDKLYDLNDSLVFALFYMPAVRADGTAVDNDSVGTSLSMASVGAKGYEAYVAKSEKNIGGYVYDSYIFDYGNAVKEDYRQKNPGKESPLLEDDISLRAEVNIRQVDDKKIVLLTLTSGKYYGQESLVLGGIRNIRGTYNG
ncbi:MAG: hypothetical protein ACOYBV_05700 [Candidatus Avilachnospira sp.]